MNNAATAREQRDVATARQLTAQATVRLDSAPQLATLLGLAGIQITDRYETQSALLQLLEYDKSVLRFLGVHTAIVATAAFSPDGAMPAISGLNGAVQTWNVADDSLRTFKGHQRTVQGPESSPTRPRWLVSGAFDGTFVLWEAPNRKIRQSVAGPISPVTEMAVRGTDPVIILASPELVNSLSFRSDRNYQPVCR